MQRSRIGLALVMVALAVVSTPLPAFAQGGAYTKFVSEDNTFGFYYPSAWDQEFDEYYGTVDLYFDAGGMFIYAPDALADMQMPGADAESFLRLLAPDWGAVSGDVTPLFDTAYMLLDGVDDEGEPYADLVFAGPLSDGRMALLDVFIYDEMLADYLDDVLLVYHTMDASPDGAQPRAVSDEMLSTAADMAALFEGVDVALSDYDGGWTAAIAELQAKELIPATGALLFAEEYAFFTGQGNFYTPLARNAPRTNFVMTAKLSFTSSGTTELETCALGMRVNWAGSETVSYLDVGYTSQGGVFYLDVPNTGEHSSDYADVALDSGEQHTFTIIAIDDLLDVYVDGALALDDIAVEARAGTWGLGLLGQNVTALCEARDIWVYALD